MKRYLREFIVLLAQLFMFYIYPLYAIRIDPMGMVILILLATLLLAIIIGSISNKRIKYLYPLVVSIIFVPSVFIYYNGSAMVHSIWYLVVSVIGLLVGCVIHKFIYKNTRLDFYRKRH